MLGRVLTSIGGILLVAAGIMFLTGNAPLPWFHGLTYLVLGAGLLLFMRQVMGHEAGRAARDKTESQRRERDDARWEKQREAERHK